MSSLQDVRWLELPSTTDSRGVLTAIEGGQGIPFEIKRVFYMHHVVADRGGHAHRDTEQVAIAAAGTHRIDVSDGEHSQTFEMTDPVRGLYIPRMTFTRLYDFSPGAVCLVLASTHYDMGRSIRSWEDYLHAIGGDRGAPPSGGRR